MMVHEPRSVDSNLVVMPHNADGTTVGVRFSVQASGSAVGQMVSPTLIVKHACVLLPGSPPAPIRNSCDVSSVNAEFGSIRFRMMYSMRCTVPGRGPGAPGPVQL